MFHDAYWCPKPFLNPATCNKFKLNGCIRSSDRNDMLSSTVCVITKDLPSIPSLLNTPESMLIPSQKNHQPKSGMTDSGNEPSSGVMAGTYHLLWGTTLLSLYVALHSIQLPLMHLCHSLTTSQILALMFTGEAASLLPFSTVIWRQWTLVSAKEWIAFGTMGLLLAAHHGIAALCAQNMALGNYIKLFH